MNVIDQYYSQSWKIKFKAIVNKQYANFSRPDDYLEEALQETLITLHKTYAESDITDALVVTIFKSKLVDKHRQNYGNPRPSAWLAAFGELGTRLFKQICLDKITPSKVLEGIAHSSQEKGESEIEIACLLDKVTLIIRKMGIKNECKPLRDNANVSISDGSEEADYSIREQDLPSTTDDSSTQLHQGWLDSLVAYLLEGKDSIPTSLKESLPTLSNVQRQILKLTFQEGLNDTHASKRMGLSYGVYRRKRDAIIESIQNGLNN